MSGIIEVLPSYQKLLILRTPSLNMAIRINTLQNAANQSGVALALTPDYLYQDINIAATELSSIIVTGA